MLSFWEKQSFVEYDYVIIGGGITGLSTAISIKENAPKARVVVLERGIFPSGASTKNAGFACFGSITELLNDLNTLGPEETKELVTERWEGLKKLRNRLGEKEIGYKAQNGYELIREAEEYALGKIDEVNDLLMPLFYQEVFTDKPKLRKNFGFSKDHVLTVVENSFEGQIDTGKMMRRLIGYACELGVLLLTGAEVQSLEEHAGHVEVIVKNTPTKDDVRIKADKVALCTNAFSKKFLPDIEVAPGRGLVLVTKPFKNLKFKGVFHYDEGYYYFRDYKDRVIFGGGRNLDPDTEASTEFEVNQRIFDLLKRQLEVMIMPGHEIHIEHSWVGIMGFGSTKKPVIQKVSDRIFAGIRLGGMGVAIGSRIGERLMKMMIKPKV
ncbi:NAD(P)/FAD-dependent oxidoreductase [Roseivirga sp. BDSF3-8]|uniref:NAD(P)/FAD-dependent oxidoreductase n=1 Tax=Roseivirga sp. BDSF3-8 TaxID=3241598 RepID=UPI0035319945